MALQRQIRFAPGDALCTLEELSKALLFRQVFAQSAITGTGPVHMSRPENNAKDFQFTVLSSKKS
ncbi:hypothetical protein KSD_94140 [Ktedonobacter sp. SOSP1-85]|nr:hypothetical protein KSD_94140 [Ktedonobacter sp. SOSP1-85]